MKKQRLPINLKRNLLFMIPLLTLFLAFSGWASSAYGQATVMTDKADYMPGEVVIVTGSGWQAGETVELEFKHEIFTDHPVEVFSTEADASGNIYDDSYIIDEWDVGERFLLTATGISSGLIATTTFTDGNLFFRGSNDEHLYTVNFIVYSDLDCESGSGSIQATGTAECKGSNGVTKIYDLPADRSISVTADEYSDLGGQFIRWEWDDGTWISDDRTICVPGSGTSRFLVAVYSPTCNYLDPPTSGGDQSVCALDPVQTLTATATSPSGTFVVWYDAPADGNIVSPTLNTIGTVTYYAETHEGDYCVSPTRTPVTLTIVDSPVADAGDGGTEYDLDFVLNATPGVGTGTWAKTSGPGDASFVPGENDPDATVTVTDYGEYEFSWTQVNGDCSDSDVITVVFIAMPAVTLQPLPQNICEGDDAVYIVGINPDNPATVKKWQVSTNGGVDYTNINDGADYSGTATDQLTVHSPDLSWSGRYYRFSYYLGNISNIDYSTGVTLTVNDAPEVSAGDNDAVCESDTYELSGSVGGGATTGLWTSSGDGAFDDATSMNAIYTPGSADITAGTVTLTLTTTDAVVCDNVSDDMVLTIHEEATTAVAGDDQANCDDEYFTLEGNTPTVGIGIWTVQSGTATITDDSSPTSGVTGVPAGTTAVLRWTITNGECSNYDEVSLTNNELPIPPDPLSETVSYDCNEHYADATPPQGSSLVWYTESSGGTVTIRPTGTNAGTYTAWAESVDDLTGCVSATRTEVTLTIEKADPTIAITWENSTYDCLPNEASATVTGACDDELTDPAVSYSYEGTGSTTYGPSTTAPTDAGTYEVTVDFAGNDNYNSAQDTKEITIDKATPVVTATWPDWTYDCTAHPASADITGACDDLSGNVVFSYTGTENSGDSYGPSVTPPTNAGSYLVTATIPESANYYEVSDSEDAIVSKADPVVLVTWTGWVYDCNTYPATATVTGCDGLITVPAVDISYSGYDEAIQDSYGPTTDSPINAGTYTATASFAGNDNYNSASDDETVTVDPKPICANYNGDVFVNTDNPDDFDADINVSVYVNELDGCNELFGLLLSFSASADGGNVSSNGDFDFHDLNGIRTFYETFEVSNFDPSALVNLEWEISGNYTNDETCENEAVITVATPSDEFVTGGGYIISSEYAEGEKAPMVGKKNNFGFNVSWGKNFKRLKGNVNIIWRQADFGFQARSNSASGIVITEPEPGIFQADIEYSNVNIKQLCEYCWSDGNGQIILTVIDRAEPGNTGSQSANADPDEIGIVVKDKNGYIIFSSGLYDAKTSTSGLQLLDGGNIQVHPASGGTTSGGTDGEVDDGDGGTTNNGRGKKAGTISDPDNQFVTDLQVYPNPTNGPVTFNFTVEEDAMTTIDIYSSSGQLVQRAWAGFAKAGEQKTVELERMLAKGFYYIRLHAGDDMKVARLVVSNRY